MERKDFFTPAFYENPELALDILNQLVLQKLVADIDMYSSGTFLNMSVHDNTESRSLLSKVISDLDAYKEYNNECFTCKCSEHLIVLCALYDEHTSAFRNCEGCKEIEWDCNAGEFLFAENFPAKFD
ncbi:hypothetical protein [Bacteroides sp.]|uniref:hypothetical protein n=1 Tax=Bacteroides sp. TaxID=29523 RepID=UPI00260DE97D|nr:hypothetical protein [Bacteroides sp.]MDD3037930.1 hypothetical protein [Bacteroides sp.]